MSEHKAMTKALAYRRGDKARKGEILDQLCRVTGWHRSHARKMLKQTLTSKMVGPRPAKQPIYGDAVIP